MVKTAKSNETAKPVILGAAVSLASKHGLHEFSRIDVSNESGYAESTVSFHFGTMSKLRTAIVQYAVENKILPILADARASRKSTGVVISEALRKKVAAYIAR